MVQAFWLLAGHPRRQRSCRPYLAIKSVIGHLKNARTGQKKGIMNMKDRTKRLLFQWFVPVLVIFPLCFVFGERKWVLWILVFLAIVYGQLLGMYLRCASVGERFSFKTAWRLQKEHEKTPPLRSHVIWFIAKSLFFIVLIWGALWLLLLALRHYWA